MIKLKFREVSPTRHYNCFHVYIAYEYGDADHRETKIHELEEFTKDDFILFLQNFFEAARLIDYSRDTGTELPDLEDQTRFEINGRSYLIPTEYDMFARDSMSNYYAEMSIESIKYFDPTGDEYEVDVE